MDNTYSNVMDGNRLAEQTVYTCRLCLQQFSFYNDFMIHQRMHLDQISLQGGLRSHYENHISSPYSSVSSSSGPLDSFDKLVQPFRGGFSELDIRGQSDLRTVSSQGDGRLYVSNSPAEIRNMVGTSPVDSPSLLPPSPAADTRNMVPSSPADHRNLVPSSPADSRNLGVSSPVDPRNMIPASPGDHRNMVPASPHNMVPASPVDHRSMVSASPASLPDKHSYRGDLEGMNMNLGSRSTPVNPQSPTVSMSVSSMSTDVRMLPGDTRPHNQIEMSRHLPVDSHGLSYSSQSFLDSLNRSLYSTEVPSKSVPPPAFSPHALGRPEDILGLDTRQHVIQKPDPYYGIPKSHFVPSSVGDSYTGNQYGISKSFAAPQPYYQQGLQTKPPPMYGADKSVTSALNYFEQSSLPETSGLELTDSSPKQTLHYGPSGLSTSTPNHSHYQLSIPQSESQLNVSQPRGLLGQEQTRGLPGVKQPQVLPGPGQPRSIPGLEQPRVQSGIDHSPGQSGIEQVQRSFHRGPSSPSPTYSQTYRGSQSHTQVYAPVPSRALPKQQDFKLSSEPVPSANIVQKIAPISQVQGLNQVPTSTPSGEIRKPSHQGVTCYICSAPFSSMADLSEHMKLHAQGMVNQSRDSVGAPVQQNIQPSPTQSSCSPAQSVNTPPQVHTVDDVKELENCCSVCGKAFLKQTLLLEHMKCHSSPQQYECKVCGKMFKKKSKCSRHEALHYRDIHLYYCEVCDMNFEHKARYLHHVQSKHTEEESARCHQHREHQAGTKKAVPLTGGSIDPAFENVGLDKYIDCQICDEEIEKEKLLSHLKCHEVFTCNNCDHVFLHKTEYVEHLMNKHRKELVAGKDDEQQPQNTNKETEETKTVAVSEPVVNPEISGNKIQGKSRREIIKDLKEKKKEVMKNLKEKEKEIEDLEKKKKEKEEKVKSKVKQQKTSMNEKEKNSMNESTTKQSNTKLSSKEEQQFRCVKCNLSFTKKSDLIQHNDKHFRDPTRIYCEICDYSYHAKEKGYYIFHMKYHRDYELMESNKPENLPCQICYVSIPKETFVTHMKRVHSQYSCDICQWSYSSEGSLVKHMRGIHGGKKYKNYVWDSSHYIENMVEPDEELEKASDATEKLEDEKSAVPVANTPVVYKKLKDLKAEQKSTENKADKTFECKECKRTFSKKQYLERHMKSHGENKQENQIVCELCSAHLDNRGTYIYHILHHSNLVKTIAAPDTRVKTETKTEPGNVVKSKVVKSESEEKQCEPAIDDNKEDKDTIKRSEKEDVEVKETESSVEQMWITVLNPETGTFEEKLIEEKQEPQIVFDIKIFEDPVVQETNDANSDMDENNQKVIDVVSEIVYCRLCNKCLKKPMLAEHFRSHLTYSCHLCKYSFIKKQRYIDHQQTLHLDAFIEQEILKFEESEKLSVEELDNSESVGDQKDKEAHKRKRSSKILNCVLCGTDIRKDKYTEHLKSHLKVSYLCQFCERSFSKKNLLAVHEKSHEFIFHERNELPYPKLCPVCCSTLKSRQILFNHLLEHLGQVSFKCKKCSNLYSSEKNLESHKKNYHDDTVKIYWKQDEEGMKFDPKTGRIHEVNSDYMNEVKELNELCKTYGKPPIWLSSTPKKHKDKPVITNKRETEAKIQEKASESPESLGTSESEGKPKSTSDEDYVPERTLRKRKSPETDSEDSDGSDASEDENYKPAKKKLRTSPRQDKKATEKSKKVSKVKSGSALSKKALLVKQKMKKLKSVASRVLRSTFDKKSVDKRGKTEEKRNAVKRTDETNDQSNSPKKRRSELENLSFEEVNKVSVYEDFPEKCPDCGIAQFSLSGYKQHRKVHNNDNPFVCPVCKQSFTRKVNMLTHIKHRHKDYKPQNLRKRDVKTEPRNPPDTGSKKSMDKSSESRILRAHTKSPSSKPGVPRAASSPIRRSELVVKLSPVDVEKNKKALKKEIVKQKDQPKVKKSYNAFLLEKIEDKSLYVCEFCKKKVTRKWNYALHLEAHKRDQREKEVKTGCNKKEVSKKDAKKKEKESKPFSCKDCSESFKKKRDLYIHTKIHSTEDEDNTADTSQISSKDVAEDRKTSETAEGSSDNGRGKVDSGAEVRQINGSKKVPSGYSRSSTDSVSSGSGKQTNKVALKQQPTGVQELGKEEPCDPSLSGMAVGTCEGKDKSSDAANQKLDGDTCTAAQNKNTGCETVHEVVNDHHNNNEDSRSLDSESDDKVKVRSQPSVNKMSMEIAVSKWKAKVTELLTSQLELYAAKKQEELDNPEIRRVKNYLSISGKEEKFKFECRICGDTSLEEEAKFRTHMEVHLNEAPPHCSICDIYFMAIHPKRRLAEHNRKKHPELNC